MPRLSRFVLPLVLLLITGCAPISLVGSWKDPAMEPKKYRKLLVVGIAEKNQMRQVFEEVFASGFSRVSASGMPSYTLTGVKDKPSRALLEEALKKSGADGVITTRLVSLTSKKDVRTGFVMTDRGYTYANFAGPEIYPTDLLGFYGASVSYATFEHKSVEVTLSTQATLETNLFDAVTGRIIWSATSSAVEPEGIITITTELADQVIKALVRDGLL